MTQDEFIQLILNPQEVDAHHVDDLKQMIDDYPYFVIPRMLLLKYYKKSGSVHFDAALQHSSVYAHDRRWLYYFLYPELDSEKPKPRKSKNVSGDYFEMIDKIESDGGDTKQSLKNLVLQLKSARELLSSDGNSLNKNNSSGQFTPNLNQTKLETEEELKIKTLIREKKYQEALEILEVLYFNNPKKSVYFADQIRFLRKVTENSK